MILKCWTYEYTDRSDMNQWSLNVIYNMVGVAVAMVIPTMHEKSCIDLHNAR